MSGNKSKYAYKHKWSHFDGQTCCECGHKNKLGKSIHSLGHVRMLFSDGATVWRCENKNNCKKRQQEYIKKNRALARVKNLRREKCCGTCQRAIWQYDDNDHIVGGRCSPLSKIRIDKNDKHHTTVRLKKGTNCGMWKLIE